MRMGLKILDKSISEFIRVVTDNRNQSFARESWSIKLKLILPYPLTDKLINPFWQYIRSFPVKKPSFLSKIIPRLLTEITSFWTENYKKHKVSKYIATINDNSN